MPGPFLRLTLALSLSLFLAGCDSAEERAQKHFERGMALLEEGEVDRALVEFRNVFNLDGFHKEARIAYAQAQEERGNTQESYGQYLRLVEQYPDNLIGRRALSRLATTRDDWDEAERHVVVAEGLAPQDPVVMSVRANLDYRNALLNGQTDAAALAVQVSNLLLEEDPDLALARRVVIDDLLRKEDWNGALEAIDDGLADAPERTLYILRLGVLEQLGREDEIFAQMKEMTRLFPDDNMHVALVRRYVEKDRVDEAEAYLRERVTESAAEELLEAQLSLIAFVTQQRGDAAAIAEVDALLEAGAENAATLRATRAALDFERGNRDESIAELEAILKDAEPSEETDRIKITLARMLVATGNSVGARARVEEVLAHDPSQVEALKLKAGWLIDDDQPGDALVELRSALDQSPRDTQILSLMARAYERSGNRELMGEMLARAAEISPSDPGPTLQYVRYLVQERKFLAAEDSLQTALRLRSTDTSLLAALGGVYVQMKDWPRAEGVIARLNGLGSDEAVNLANELTARVYAGKNQAAELESFLQGMTEGDSNLQASATILRLRLAQGDIEGAIAYAEELLAADPENPTLRFIRAGVLARSGEAEQARAALEELTEDAPDAEAVWLALYRLHLAEGDTATATDVLNRASANLPDSLNLKWAAAAEAERRGDIAEAIAIYEEMYAVNSNSLVIANNLASLISSYQDNEETLQRAYTIARRLRGTEVPAFQDTYGWIRYKMGDLDEALEYIEPASGKLPEDPTIRYHLAQIYAALGRDSDALEQYRKALELIDNNSARYPFVDHVTEEITRLEAQ